MEDTATRPRPERQIWVIASLAAGVLLAGLLLLLSPWENREAATSLASDLDEPPTIPPIDEEAPMRTETATFALG